MGKTGEEMENSWLLLLLVFFLSTGHSLKCYECPKGGLCGEGEMGVARTCNNGRNTVCIKIQEISGQTQIQGHSVSRVMRICGNHDYAKGPDTCQDTTVKMPGSDDTVGATLCTCNTDLCNNAGTLTHHCIIISIVSFIFINTWL